MTSYQGPIPGTTASASLVLGPRPAVFQPPALPPVEESREIPIPVVERKGPTLSPLYDNPSLFPNGRPQLKRK